MISQIIRDKKQQRRVVMCLAFAAFMATLDMYIVNISLPTIAGHFHVGASMASWIPLSYLLATAATLLLVGKFCDKYGLKNIFLIGFGTFTLGSLFCGVSPNLRLLIASRCIQGVGGSMMIIAAYAAIPRYIPSEKTGWAFGTLATASAVGIMCGAPLGGVITGYLVWNWIFLINVPVGIIAIIMAKKVMPPAVPASEREKVTGFDISGAVLSGISFLALVYALNRGDTFGWTSVRILSFFGLSAITMAAFIYKESVTKDPMLDLRLFSDANFSYVNIATLLGYMLLAGSNFLMPFYLMLIKGLSPQRAGFIIIIYSIVYLCLAPFFGKLSDRIKPRYLCMAGMLLAAGASGMFFFSLKDASFLDIVIFMVWMGLSYAFFIAPNNSQVMALAPDDNQGMASGVLIMMKTLSLVLGVNIFATIFSFSMPHRMSLTHGGVVKSTATADMLIRGFERAYLFGIFVCIAAAVLTYLAKLPNKKISV